MKFTNNKGFTLIEVIVVAAIIAVLAGILVPLIFKQIDESKISRASADIKSISTAILVMKKDTGSWPISATCSPHITMLKGDGPLPAFSGGLNWDTSASDGFHNFLNIDDSGCWPITWKGPYMAIVNPDPWGNAYFTNSKEFLRQANVWIMSAGPNGTVETDYGSANLVGDDIGVRIK